MMISRLQCTSQGAGMMGAGQLGHLRGDALRDTWLGMSSRPLDQRLIGLLLGPEGRDWQVC